MPREWPLIETEAMFSTRPRVSRTAVERLRMDLKVNLVE